MKITLQIVIWLVGIGCAIYFALFGMFIGGMVDAITSIISMAKDTVIDGTVVTLVWGIVKIMFASFVAWLIIITTSVLSMIVGEWLD